MKRGIGGWWAQHFLLAEWVLSIIVSFGAIFWMERFNGLPVMNAVLHGSRGAIYGTLASIFGSLLGFIITAVSIALAFSASDKLTVLRGSKYYPQLWGVFLSATRCLATVTVAAMVALIGDRDMAPIRWLTYTVLVLTVLSVARVARCIWVLENIVKIVTKPPQSDQNKVR
jgi:hypothetical protein